MWQQNGSRAEPERKFRTQKGEWNEGRAEAEYDGRWSSHNRDRHEWRNNDRSQMQKHKLGATSTVRSVAEEGSEYGNRPLQVNGLNETKPIYNYNTYYGEGVETRDHETNHYSSDYKEETTHSANNNHSPLPNSFRISRNRPQYGDEHYHKPSNLSESFIIHPADSKIGLR